MFLFRSPQLKEKTQGIKWFECQALTVWIYNKKRRNSTDFYELQASKHKIYLSYDTSGYF